MFLNDGQIRNLIKEENLIEGYIDLERQLQPSGFDLTVKTVGEFVTGGKIDFDNSKRIIPLICKLRPNEDKWYLIQGTYLVEFNEYIRLPPNIMAFTIQRSTVMRCGCSTQVGLWDPGYEGRGKSILIVNNLEVDIYKNARLVQMVFARIEKSDSPYKGKYQKEGTS